MERIGAYMSYIDHVCGYFSNSVLHLINFVNDVYSVVQTTPIGQICFVNKLLLEHIRDICFCVV